jgi:hypothetical protein
MIKCVWSQDVSCRSSFSKPIGSRNVLPKNHLVAVGLLFGGIAATAAIAPEESRFCRAKRQLSHAFAIDTACSNRRGTPATAFAGGGWVKRFRIRHEGRTRPQSETAWPAPQKCTLACRFSAQAPTIEYRDPLFSGVPGAASPAMKSYSPHYACGLRSGRIGIRLGHPAY